MENVYSLWLFTSYAEKPVGQRLCKSLGKKKCLLVSSLGLAISHLLKHSEHPTRCTAGSYYDVNNLGTKFLSTCYSNLW